MIVSYRRLLYPFCLVSRPSLLCTAAISGERSPGSRYGLFETKDGTRWLRNERVTPVNIDVVAI